MCLFHIPKKKGKKDIMEAGKLFLGEIKEKIMKNLNKVSNKFDTISRSLIQEKVQLIDHLFKKRYNWSIL